MTSRIVSLVVGLLLTPPLAWNQERSAGITGPSHQLLEPSISAVRLHVPRTARELYHKATKIFLNHDYRAAQEKLHQALHLYAAFPEALTMLGYIHLEQNQWEPEQNLQAAVRSDPTYGSAYLVLSLLYNRQERFDDAIEMAQRANALMPGAGWLRMKCAARSCRSINMRCLEPQ